MAPEASPGLTSSPRGEAPSPPLRPGVLLVLAATGIAVHAWFILGGPALDTDRSLVLLMARRFARGDVSFYFWQQNYMAAFEPLLLAPLARAGWASPVVAGWVGLGITAVLAFLSVALARRLGGVAWVALLLWAVPPAVVVHHHVALYGARLAATGLAVGAFAWSLKAASRREWITVGVLAGLAYLGDHLMLPWVGGVLWIAVSRGRLRPVALASAAVVLVDTAMALATPAVHLSGPNQPESWIHNLPVLFGTTLPQLFGLLYSRGPSPLFQQPAPVVPPGTVWLLFAIPGALVLAALAWTLVRQRHVFLRHMFRGRPAPGADALQALLLTCALALGLFAFVGGGGDRWPVRYLVPLWPAISILAAWAVARWRAPVRPLAALVVLPGLFTLATDPAWPRAGDAQGAQAEVQAVAQALDGTGVHAVWADYWDAYRMALAVGEPPLWFPMRIIERRPLLLAEARSRGPAGYLVRPGDTQVLDLLETAAASGTNRRIQEREAGPFRLVVMARPVLEAELRFPPPPRRVQVLAAAGAGLLFLGSLAVAAALARVRERSL